MSEVLFYHLERSTMEQVLPGLLEKTLGRGWRALVKVGNEDALDALDEHLWTYADESFLPHGTTEAARQPIFLMAEGEVPDGFDVLFLVAAGELPVAQFSGFTRTVVMFAEDAAPKAREQWKAVKAEGFEATYWRQSSAGKWEKAA